ncbi:MAG: GIY-YIG nuclease family protein [Planctomycetaceae bacterium]|nr:GIY-YIG nuclease family protein [Planctomycetaceae bacterium]MBT6494791.1 GIY-YIG nuclease family protein [Planctomycetaceae bacterium]
MLAAVAVFGLVALVAIFNSYIVATVCSLAAIGFAAFGFVRHAEARQIEASLEYMNRMKQYGEVMRDRVSESIFRYNHLLRTGDTRIEHYYNDIYLRAEKERKDAEAMRGAAQRDRRAVKHVEDRIFQMAARFIQDHLKWVSQKLRPDPENYQRNKLQLIKAFDFIDGVGYDVPRNLRKDSMKDLKSSYRVKVREQTLKDEQRRIKQQMREEEKARKEREQALQEAEQRENDIQKRLDEALREHADEHGAEIEELKRQLAEAHANSERALSMAQQTKVGHVYILSNIGSFGEGIFKVGMTRRVEPQLRVKELGDASVPFPFDVHAMITCDDAPKLEKTLHHELTRYRVNRVNLRKEYFAVQLDTILAAVRTHHGKVEYVAEPEALEYRETQEISPDELVEVESELVEIGADFEDFDE